MPEYLTSVDDVRTRAGLSANEGTGAPSAAQIEAAITLATEEMSTALTDYDTVLGYSDADLEDPAKKKRSDAYKKAESYFAIAALSEVLDNQRLGQGGVITKSTIGQAESIFASLEGESNRREVWTKRAFRALGPYLTPLQASSDDEDSEDVGISDDEGFSFMAI